jgi:hypothetical protein
VNQDPRNSNVAQTWTFTNQHVLNEVVRDPEAERLALRYLDRHAPDLVGVILGGVL